MQEIRFSRPFFNVIKQVCMVTKAKTVKFFHDGDKSCLNIHNENSFIHISAGPADFSFDGLEVNSSSFIEFIRFAELIGYPETGTIVVDNEETIAGHVYEFIRFGNGTETARSLTAEPSFFNEDDTKVPSSREADPMSLLATIKLNKKDLEKYVQKLKLVPGCQFFSVNVTEKGEVKFYFKGRVGQQITSKVDYTMTLPGDSKAIAIAYGKDSKQRYRKIPTSIFTVLKGLGCEEYDMEIRYFAADYDSIALKAFANLQGNDQMYPIGIYAMIVECSGAEENAEELVD